MKKIDKVFPRWTPARIAAQISVVIPPSNHLLCHSEATRDVLVLSTTGNHERGHGRILPAI
jgi:hypothetical protein